MLSGDARSSDTADGEGEPAGPSQEAPQVPVFDSMDDFPLEQSRQLVNHPAIPRAPLRPLPLMEVPFERIGMDLIGPFHQSARGYRFVLVLVDYATRYPQAVPLRTISAKNCGAGTVSSYLPSRDPERDPD